MRWFATVTRGGTVNTLTMFVLITLHTTLGTTRLAYGRALTQSRLGNGVVVDLSQVQFNHIRMNSFEDLPKHAAVELYFPVALGLALVPKMASRFSQ